MASTYVNNLRLEEIGSGEQSGSWGDTTNLNLEIIGQSTAWGTRAIANASTDNITIADGALDADRSLGLKLTGGGQACTITLLPNTSSKTWFMYNATNFTLTFTCGSGANVAILAGQTKVIATDGLGSGGVVHDLLTAVNLAGVTAVDDLKVGGDILIGDAHFIADAAGNEQLVFQTTGSAVNQLEITNAASSSAFLQGPLLKATGGDSNIDLNLIAKGTGVIAVRGNSASGAVQLNCESNSHGQILQGQPHSAGVTNTMLLPTGANSTLVSLVSADVLTNKTLTAAKIADAGFIADANGNELVVFQTTGSAVNQLEITNNASGSNPIIAATGGDTNIGIALTPKGTGEIVIAAGNLNYSGTAITTTGAEINLIDGDTARGTTAVADGDGVLINDAGTMRMTTVDTLATYVGTKVGGSGKVLQVVNVLDSTARTASAGNHAIAVQASITPSSTSSKIAMFGSVAVQYTGGGEIKMYRNYGASGSTQLGEDQRFNGEAGVDAKLFPFHFYDSPNTTSARSYTVFFETGGTHYTNYSSSQSVMFLMEIDNA